jgi:hypothetical protein
MKLKNRKSLYFFVPLGLIIKVVITIVLLNLPGGCSEEKDRRRLEKENGNFTALSISAERSE